MAWPPGYPGYGPPPIQPAYTVPYVPPQPVYTAPAPNAWPPGQYQAPSAYQPPQVMVPPSTGMWPPGHPMNTQGTTTPPPSVGWTSTGSSYGSGYSTPGYPTSGMGSNNYNLGSTGSGYGSNGGTSYSNNYNTGSAWPPSTVQPTYASNPAPVPSSNYLTAPAKQSPVIQRSYTQPLKPVGSQPNTGYPTGYPPSAVGSNPYPSYSPNSYVGPSTSPYTNPYAAAPGSNPFAMPANNYAPPSNTPVGGGYGTPLTAPSNVVSPNTPVGPYGAPLGAVNATERFSPKTGRSDSVGVSPVAQILIKEQQEELARQEARKKAESEAAAKKAALEALQRRETTEAQRASFLHQMEMDRIEKEAQDARAELERQQHAALTAEEQRRKDLLARAQRETEEIEAKNRAALRLRAQQDETRLRAEQERLDRRQAELAAKERAMATAAERQRQEQQDAQRAREAEMAKQAEESEKLQQSFYSAILEVAKILATTNQRIVKIITLSYQEMATALAHSPPGDLQNSPEAQFLSDLLGHLDKTANRLVSMIQDNVMNVDDSVHSSIAKTVSNLTSSISSLLQFCRRLVTQPLDAELSAISPDDRQSSAKKRATAVTYAIKEVLQYLEKMKIEETTSTDGATKVLSAQSTDEATKNVEATLAAQAGERSRIQVQLGITTKKPVLLSANYDPNSVDLSKYDPAKISVLQRAIHHWAMRLHFNQLVNLLTQNNKESAANTHRKKVLFEVLSTEASYFQTLDTIVEYFYKPLSGASKKPNNGIITPDEVTRLFGSIEAIHRFSKKLLAEFDARLQKWPGVQFFGDIFLDQVDEMMVYSDYINGFDEATTVLKKLLLNPKFVAFEQECMKATGKRLDLASLLIQPVQRMPRYGLLLKELISHSPPEHIDYHNLVEAKAKVQEVCSEINKKKQEYDNKAALQRISNEILGLPSPLNPSTSLFITSEYVSLEGDSKHWARAYLFSDLIVFAKSKSEKTPPPYHFWEAFPLVNVGVVGRKGHRKSFLMWDKTGHKKLERILHFTEELTSSRWLKDMKEAIETASIQAMLSDDMDGASGSGALAIPQSKQGHLTLLCASYGDLSNPNATIDVTSILQRIIMDQGGKSLTLSAAPKSSLPGFIDPAKSKKKSLLIVYTYGGPPKTRSFMDESPIQITS